MSHWIHFLKGEQQDLPIIPDDNVEYEKSSFNIIDLRKSRDSNDLDQIREIYFLSIDFNIVLLTIRDSFRQAIDFHQFFNLNERPGQSISFFELLNDLCEHTLGVDHREIVRYNDLTEIPPHDDHFIYELIGKNDRYLYFRKTQILNAYKAFNYQSIWKKEGHKLIHNLKIVNENKRHEFIPYLDLKYQKDRIGAKWIRFFSKTKEILQAQRFTRGCTSHLTPSDPRLVDKLINHFNNYKH